MKALLGDYVEEECLKAIRSLHRYGMAHEVLEFARALLAACDEDFVEKRHTVPDGPVELADSAHPVRLVLIRGKDEQKGCP